MSLEQVSRVKARKRLCLDGAQRPASFSLCQLSPTLQPFGSCVKLCVRCDAWGCTCYACTDLYVPVVSGMQTISAPTPRLSHIQLPTIEDKLVVDKRPDSVIRSSAAVFCTATQLAGGEAQLSKKFSSAFPQPDKLSRHANVNSQPQDTL